MMPPFQTALYQRHFRSDRSALPATGFVFMGLTALCALMVVAERAGLPRSMSESAMALLLVMALGGLACMGRTAEEAVFTGRSTLMGPMLAGLVAGTVLAGLGPALLRPVMAWQLGAILAGQCIGIILAHGLVRWQAGRGAAQSAALIAHNPLLAIIAGALQTVVGTIAGLLVLMQLGGDLAALVKIHMPGLSPVWGNLLLLILPVLAIATGGLRATTMLLTGTAVLVFAGYGAILATGLSGLGALPLPWFSESTTLVAIMDAKSRWFSTPVHPVVLMEWPGMADAFSRSGSILLLGSASISGLVMLMLSPALPVRRRSMLLPTLGTSLLLPLCIVISGGYAIEAAGFQFVGASVQRPPAGLLEAGRSGFVTVCNGAPLSADAVRAACGVSPRDVMLLDWQQVQINRSFLSGGLLAAMASPAAPGLLARVAEPLLLFAGLSATLWMAARGLGLGVLARDRMAPGLASVRLGLVRLAALLLAGVLCVGATLLSGQTATLWSFAAVAAACGVVLAVVMRWLEYRQSGSSQRI